MPDRLGMLMYELNDAQWNQYFDGVLDGLPFSVKEVCRFSDRLLSFAVKLPVGVYLALRSVPESDGADWKAAVAHKLMVVTESETGYHEWTPLGNAVKRVIEEAMRAGS